jgi:hypothetical protein
LHAQRKPVILAPPTGRPVPGHLKPEFYLMKTNVTLALVLFSSLFATTGFSQRSNSKEQIFQPGPYKGKDAWLQNIQGLPAIADKNFGDADQLIAESWTFYGLGGSTGQLRGLLDFTDLQQIPQGAKVNFAYLHLYGVPTSAANDRGNQGGNTCYLQRVISAWEENTVTWNNQPRVTPVNQVLIPASNGVTWNYNVTLNVTKLVQDIIDLPPGQRYGFCIRLQQNDYYRSMLFASSDYAEAGRRPKLRISYEGNNAPVEETTTVTTEVVMEKTTSATQGISAELRTDLEANKLYLNYGLVKDGKTTLQIISSKGTQLKSYELENSRGRHEFTIELDAALLTLMKETSATIKITQGRTEISFPFLDE